MGFSPDLCPSMSLSAADLNSLVAAQYLSGEYYYTFI